MSGIVQIVLDDVALSLLSLESEFGPDGLNWDLLLQQQRAR